jgi:hypothetical protein
MHSEMVAAPLPETTQEAELLVGIGQRVSLFGTLTRDEQDQLLMALEAYECLGQVVKLLNWRISRFGVSQLGVFSDYLWLMRIHYLGLEDFESYFEVALRGIVALNVPFSVIQVHIAESILGTENYRDQVRLFSKLSDSLASKDVLIPMLERLAIIYEKKLFLDDKVSSRK